MKLIDLLVKILPGINGWPDDCIFAAYQDGYVKYYIKHKDTMVPKPFHLTQLAIVPIDFDTAIATRDQYQAALAASQEVEWSGAGIPPVGCECEWQDKNTKQWQPVKVVYSSEWVTVVREINKERGDDLVEVAIENYGDDSRLKFRPLHTEAERKHEAVLESICAVLEMVAQDYKREDEAKLIYEAIAAGKIPGVKLDD